MSRVTLREIGHSRAGDKGNTSSVSFFVYDPAHYEHVRLELTAERVKQWFGDMVGEVRRYDVPSLDGFNFVMTDTLGGGVTTSLALDAHGKSRSSYFLEQEIDIPDTPDAHHCDRSKRYDEPGRVDNDSDGCSVR